MFTWILNAAVFFHFTQTCSSEGNCGAETNPLPADGFGILTASWQAVEQQRCSTIINMAQQPGGCNKNPPKSELPRGKKWLKNQFLAQWLLLAVKPHLITVLIISNLLFSHGIPSRSRHCWSQTPVSRGHLMIQWLSSGHWGSLSHKIKALKAQAQPEHTKGHCRLQAVWHRGNSCSQGHTTMEASRNTFLPNWAFLAFASYSHIHAHKHDGCWRNFCGEKSLYTF